MLTPRVLCPRFSSSIFALTALIVFASTLHAQRVMLRTSTPGVDSPTTDIVDAGAVPNSQPLHLTLRLASSPDRSAALDQLLANQITQSSSSFHQWLTPQQFATGYGATGDQIAAATAWLQSQGLSVDMVSAGKTRLSVSGTAGQVQSAFAVTLRRYNVSGASHFANSTRPSVPQVVGSIISGISGLDDMPAAAPSTVGAFTSTGPVVIPAAATQSSDPYVIAAGVVDANSAPILALTTSVCSTDLTQSDYDAYHDLFRQANVQGITILATSGCGTRGTGSFPASLGEVTALTIAPVTAPFNPIAPRPAWQSAPGLPDDANRYEPDLTTSSINDFAQAIGTILQQSKTRQGNINATLYALAPTKGLYTQPDATATTVPGTWEQSTGLGVVDLVTLLKVYPRATGSLPTTTSLVSSSYAVNYGQPFTLTAAVVPSGSFANSPPSGTVSFTSSQGTIGTANLANGNATFTVGTLNVGTYSVTANYLGDGNYTGSASTSSVIITVSIVNANLVATIAPSTNVPYGATGTVTATVTLPNSSAAPVGNVSAAIEGVNGSVFNATLSPNPGGNSATANIVVAVPAPGAYTVQVTCAGNQNFQCQTPVNIPVTTVKGNTLTSITVTPSAPQAGQPVSLTATIGNSGNATGTFSFTGNVTFYDNGKLIATAPIGTNQATTTVSLSGNVTHSIIATYSGDVDWNSSGSAAVAVNPILLPSTLTLTSNVSNQANALAGVNIVFTATVFTTVTNTVGPTGNVTFFNTYNGAIFPLGTLPLTPNGPTQSIAVFSTTGLLAGTNNVYAVYNGDADFNPATSSPLALTLSDYNLTMIPQTLTVSRGKSGQSVMLLGLVGGFSGTVTFGCTPPSSTETTCSFSPASLTGGGSTTMTIVTTAPTTSTTTQQARMGGKVGGGWNLAAGATLAALFCFGIPRRRRTLANLLLLLLAIGITANFGCGDVTSKSPSDPTDPGTPLGTQIFTITAAGNDGVSTTRHTYQYQVTVQ